MFCRLGSFPNSLNSRLTSDNPCLAFSIVVVKLAKSVPPLLAVCIPCKPVMASLIFFKVEVTFFKLSAKPSGIGCIPPSLPSWFNSKLILIRLSFAKLTTSLNLPKFSPLLPPDVLMVCNCVMASLILFKLSVTVFSFVANSSGMSGNCPLNPCRPLAILTISPLTALKASVILY